MSGEILLIIMADATRFLIVLYSIHESVAPIATKVREKVLEKRRRAEGGLERRKYGKLLLQVASFLQPYDES